MAAAPNETVIPADNFREKLDDAVDVTTVVMVGGSALTLLGIEAGSNSLYGIGLVVTGATGTLNLVARAARRVHNYFSLASKPSVES
ncbi:hypothetical protein KC992_03395 [Candidatus Saccharibacteria bacterium]|nr:hypothetical protein [Candidatus Saccharibacteria bacterium]MCA9341290.1 hypothetical protein [Candidatus Saccharibacteria bacterium]